MIEKITLFDKKRQQVFLIGILLLAAFFLDYYFRVVLGTGRLLTHFFYIPIVLACIWWGRKGLYVSIFLILLFSLGHKVYGNYQNTANDYLRATMLLFTSLIIVMMSERLSYLRKTLHQSEEKYRTIFENTGNATIIIEKDRTISLANSEFARLWGYSKNKVEGKKKWPEFVAEEDLERMKAYHEQRRIDPKNAPRNYEFQFVTREKEVKDILITIDMIPGTDKSVASFMDITQLKKTMEHEKLLQEKLSNALAKVLGGLIPICANCKKIRDKDNRWVQLEAYIHGKTEANFSHGICPECAKELYPSVFSEKDLQRIYSKSA